MVWWRRVPRCADVSGLIAITAVTSGVAGRPGRPYTRVRRRGQAVPGAIGQMGLGDHRTMAATMGSTGVDDATPRRASLGCFRPRRPGRGHLCHRTGWDVGSRSRCARPVPAVVKRRRPSASPERWWRSPEEAEPKPLAQA